jgi:hypothetical protein
MDYQRQGQRPLVGSNLIHYFLGLEEIKDLKEEEKMIIKILKILALVLMIIPKYSKEKMLQEQSKLSLNYQVWKTEKR